MIKGVASYNIMSVLDFSSFYPYRKRPFVVLPFISFYVIFRYHVLGYFYFSHVLIT